MSQDIIHKYQIFAKKWLGQNFLVNSEITSEISGLIDIEWKNIIEVWPWYGALTEKLLEKKPKSLQLIELDRDMVEILEDRIHIWELNTWKISFEIFMQDVLTFTPELSEYCVIANIPYYITSPILRHFLYDVDISPENMIILMQKDVWDKILGKWKNKSSVLSLIIEKKCTVTQEIFVWKENFIPAPKIESSVLLFETHNDYEKIDDKIFLEVIKKWFLAPRKKLLKNLIMWWFEKSKVEDFFCQQWYNENLRGEDLSIFQWCDLVDYLS